MQPNYQKFHKPVIASIVLLVFVNIIQFALSINDIFYFRRIIAGESVPESANTFFVEKNQIIYWANTTTYLIFLLSFLVWFYYAYKNIYVRESADAPYKPAIVPFSYIIPIFNLYAPYQIMRFIWWGNASSDEEVSSGFKMIKLWWFITILNAVLSRVAANIYSKSVYAEEFMKAAYFYLFIYILSIHFLWLTYKLVINSSRTRVYR
jgi:hypothetical protein